MWDAVNDPLNKLKEGNSLNKVKEGDALSKFKQVGCP